MVVGLETQKLSCALPRRARRLAMWLAVAVAALNRWSCEHTDPEFSFYPEARVNFSLYMIYLVRFIFLWEGEVGGEKVKLAGMQMYILTPLLYVKLI